MKNYTEIEHLTIHNECEMLIQQYITTHTAAYTLDQLLLPTLGIKLKLLYNILHLDIYHSVAYGSLCDYSMKQVIIHARNLIARSFRENVLNPLFII
jgi:hypothetical protein